MNNVNMKVKDTNIKIRINKDDKEKFIKLCEDNSKVPTKVLHSFILKYIGGDKN